MKASKTQLVAKKGKEKRIITKSPTMGWPLPPEEGRGSYVGGTGANKECLDRWKAAGWTVKRQPNPHYTAPLGMDI